VEISESSKIGATQFIDDENNENTDFADFISAETSWVRMAEVHE